MNPFPSQTSKEFFEAVETYRLYRRGNLQSVALAAGRHLKSGAVVRSEVAPCLAAVQARFLESPPWLPLRLFWRGVIWITRNVIYRNYPMWNDYHMALWQLTRDPQVVEDLRAHLEAATAPLVIETGAWMIRSVCQQDPEFAQLWHGGVELLEEQ
jgi:hypothetical protein